MAHRVFLRVVRDDLFAHHRMAIDNDGSFQIHRGAALPEGDDVNDRGRNFPAHFNPRNLTSCSLMSGW